jgi:acyl-coenzyme A thioesterase PaaI-like protein
LFHPAGAVHGSAYFKALDDAAFIAVDSLVEDLFGLTVSFNIHLTRPISGGEMRAVGQVVFASKTLFVAESLLFEATGQETGRGSGTFVPSRIELTAEMGYAL